MGIPMPNIHSTGVDAFAYSQSSDIDKELDDLPLLELIKRKERLESELSALGSVLDSHGVRMTTSLTTFDGYPRSDIDVTQVRTTRARIIHLRNDHKALLSRIETGLHAHFAAQAAAASDSSEQTSAVNNSAQTTLSRPSSAAATSTSTTSEPWIGPPFASVNSVSSGSPASAAGLQIGDKIQKFGEADWFNNEKLALVARIVGRSEGRSLNVVVLRLRGGGVNEEQVPLTLVPRRDWGGRGLLGCHLLPL